MNVTGFVIVYNDAGQAGLQDKDGKLVVPCQYDKILDYDDDGYIRVLKGDVYGTLEWNCQEVIPHSLGLTHLGVFYEGTASAVKNRQVGTRRRGWERGFRFLLQGHQGTPKMGIRCRS